MKYFSKFGAVAILVFASSTFLAADTIQLGSFASGAASLGNSNTAMNFAGFNTAPPPSAGVWTSFTLDPGTLWAAPVANSTWVGATATAGPIGTSNPALGYYTFTTTFSALSTGPYSGTLSLLADDTAEVLLNGSVLVPLGPLGTDAHCASTGVSCLAIDTIALSGLSLLTGPNANTLTFVVQQAGAGPTGGTGDPSGLDFAATISTPLTTAVPEPNTLMLMGAGLFGLAGMMWCRIRV